MPIEQTLAKIEQEIAAKDYDKARDRLLGLISTYPDDLSLRRRLGDVYWMRQNPKQAGRFWFLVADKSPEMASACREFAQSCQDDPLKILLGLRFKGDVAAIEDDYARNTIQTLHEEAKAKHRNYVDFQARGAAKYKPPAQINRYIGIAALVGCLIILAMVLVLVVIGGFTLYEWFF